MAAQYPGTLVTTSGTTGLPSTRADNTASQTTHIQDHNNANQEIVAIELELGLLPKGGYTDVVTRLNRNASTQTDDKIRRAISRSTAPVFVAQTLDIAMIQQALGDEATLTDQRLGGGMVIMEEDVSTVVGIAFRVSTAGVGVTYTNFCGVALYSIDPSTYAWTRVAVSANQRSGGAAGVFDSTGFKQVAFTGTVNLTKGTIYQLVTLTDSSAGTKSKLAGQLATGINDFADTSVGRFMAQSGVTGTPAASYATGSPVTNSHWLALYK